jgi:hypothetical protein
MRSPEKDPCVCFRWLRARSNARAYHFIEAHFACDPAMCEDWLIPVVVGPVSRRTCSTGSSTPTCSPAAQTRREHDSPLHDALDRRVILREDTSESITCDEVVTSQTTQLTSQP